MKRLLTLSAAFAMTGLLLSGAGLAQDQATPQKDAENAAKQETKHAEVVNIENNVITVTMEGKRHSLRLDDEAKVMVRGEERALDDLELGDFVDVRVSSDDPDKLLLLVKRDRDSEPRVSRRIGLDDRQPMHAVRASKLIGMDVKNRQGEDLGEIEDVVLDTHAGDVRYVVLSFGGFLDIGDKYFALPWQGMTIAHEKDDADNRFLVLDATKERLESMPGFDKDNWPAMADSYWQDVNTFHIQNRQQQDIDRKETTPERQEVEQP